MRYCLRKMRSQDAAEEKKRQRQAKLDTRKAEEGGEAASPATAKGPAKAKAKRGRTVSAEGEAEAAAKKVKA